MADNVGFGSPGDFLPTAGALLVLSLLWGTTQYADGTVFFGLVIGTPLALGMLSAATVRMVMGPARGGLAAVGGGGIGVFALMFAIAAITSKATADGVIAFQSSALALSFVVGAVGSFLGALSLNHYRITDTPDADDEDLAEDDGDGDDVDYTTQPEELVCLLTNQVVNPDHDKYVVCHSVFNQSETCHAVYLMDYVHLLDGRCRRCFSQLRERDLQGMN